MFSSRWATEEELKERLKKVNIDSKIEKAGLPLMYDSQNIYVDESSNHTIVIGSTGSGKTQSIHLPLSHLSIMAGESLVINDIKGEIYNSLKKDLKANDYNIIKLDLSNPSQSNCFNIFSLAYNLYINNNKDKAMEVLESTIEYILMEKNAQGDPFWVNTSTDYLTGIILYLFQEEKKVPTLLDVYKLAIDFDENLLDSMDKTSSIYVNLAPTVLAPNDTKGSIISVLTQKMRTILSREELTEVLNKNDFDFADLITKKTALFIIGSETNCVSSIIVPIIITQIYYTVAYMKKSERRINILIDEFEKILPIKDFEVIADYSRSNNIRYVIFIKSLLELISKYGKEKAELIRLSFGTIIYLLANDMETLESISKLCGNVVKDNITSPLISSEELKLLKYFEAVVLIPRMYPVRTKLLPDYEYPWNK